MFMENAIDWGNIEEKNKLSMQAVFSDGVYTWISNFEYNCLVKIEEATNSIVGAEPFVQENIDEFAIHKGVVRYKNKIVFYPNRGSGLNIINLDSGEQEYCSLEGYVIKEKRCKFSAAVLVDEELWLIPQDYYQNMLIVNLEDFQVVVCSWWNEMLKEYAITDDVAFMGADIWKNNLLISVRKQNYFLKCSLVKEKVEKITVKNENVQVHRVFAIKDTIWCTCSNSADLYIVSENGEVEKVISPHDGEYDFVPYMTLVPCENGVAVIPRYKNEITIYKYTGEKMAEMHLQYYRGAKNKNTVIYNFATKKVGNKLILYPNHDGMVKEVDLSDFSVEEYCYNNISEFHNYYAKYMLPIYAERESADKGYIIENARNFSLTEYLCYLSVMKELDEKRPEVCLGDKTKSCAEKIVEEIKVYIG